MTIAAALTGLINRGLPSRQGSDGSPARARLSVFGDLSVQSVVPAKQLLADEGSYFVANNAQTGIATAAAPVSFSATNPFVVIQNSSVDLQGPRLFLDVVSLLNTAAGTAGASVYAAVTVDAILRYASGGTVLTPVRVNGAGKASVAQAWAGNITAAAASSQARTVGGMKALKGAIPVAGDTLNLFAGMVDAQSAISISTITMTNAHIPPVIINPGESALVHLWLPSQSAASSWAPELGWWER